MNVLILSCNTGGGHNAAARAVAEVFRAHGDEAVVLDYLKLAGEKVSRTVGNVYVETVKIAPGLFGLLYKIGMLVSRLLRRSPVYYVNGKMAVYLAAYLKKHPADVIVMPHLYPAETITYMKRKGMKLPLTVAVMTDYTCIPFWEETDCDYYMIPHESLIPEIVKRGIPEEKLVVTGIPVAAACSEPWSGMPERKCCGGYTRTALRAKNAQQAAKRVWDSKKSRGISLVAGGSMGSGIDRPADSGIAAAHAKGGASYPDLRQQSEARAADACALRQRCARDDSGKRQRHAGLSACVRYYLHKTRWTYLHGGCGDGDPHCPHKADTGM